MKKQKPRLQRGANAFFASSSIRTVPSASESHRINRFRGSRAWALRRHRRWGISPRPWDCCIYCRTFSPFCQ